LAAALIALSGAPAAAAPSPDMAALAFKDSVEAPPAGWSGPVFKLSHDYPRTKPSCEAPWLRRKVSFTASNPQWGDYSDPGDNWAKYAGDLIDYVWQGQDPNLPDASGWSSTVGGATWWYHMPWMAYDGQLGREFVHGLTNERSADRQTFGPRSAEVQRGSLQYAVAGAAPDKTYQTWSVGMYNACGAWSVGQAIPPSGVPATFVVKGGGARVRGLPFPEGTVVIKVLNTTADGRDVPYLRRSTSWSADIHANTADAKDCRRTIGKVHLVQMDIAAVDRRSPTGWVYMTLAYDGLLPGGSVRSRLIPVGVQWGDDPASFPNTPQAGSPPLRETVLAPMGIFQHYGCGGRLAGVVDNAKSSCVSCHMSAFAAPAAAVPVQGLDAPPANVPPAFGFNGLCTAPGGAGNKAYFSNYRYPQTYPSGQFPRDIPLDSSLQLATAFQSYAKAVNQAPANASCTDGPPS
jgi:hypothetical protein